MLPAAALLDDDAPPPATAGERLRQAVDRALAGCGGSIERAIATLSAELEQDAGLCRVAFQHEWSLVVGNLIRKAVATRGMAHRLQPHKPAVPEEPPLGIEAPKRPESQARPVESTTGNPPAPSPATGGPANQRDAGTVAPKRNGCEAQPPTGAASRHSTSRSPAHRGAAGLVAVARVAARTILDTHSTDLGRPLGDCSRADLHILAGRSRRRGEFYARLADRMPIDGPVREHVTADDVEALWVRIVMANEVDDGN